MIINLEWLRTFRTVYKTASLTKASERLMITQPAVSQHIAALEARAGKKLFIRKSRGVAPTEYARTLNNMVAGTLDDLEEVEALFHKRSPKLKPVVSIGVSEHLYTSALSERLCEIDAQVHIRFGDQSTLVKEVEQGDLTFAVIPEFVNTYDTLCHPLFRQTLILVYTPDIDIRPFEELFAVDKKAAERWLSKQDWYSHRSITPFIKQFWLNVFNKKRPTIVPKRIVPNENEILYQLSRGSGLALCYDTNAAPFIGAGELVAAAIPSMLSREVTLLAHKNVDREFFDRLTKLLKQ